MKNERVRNKVWDAIEAGVWVDLGAPLSREIRHQIWENVWGEVRFLTRTQVHNMLWDTVYSGNIWEDER